MSRERRAPLWTAVFLAPALLLTLGLVVLPLLDSLRAAFFSRSEIGGDLFVGFGAFQRLLTGDQAEGFLNALGNTLQFFAVHALVQNPLGLALAALVHFGLTRGKSLFRSIFYLPTLLSFVSAGFVWKLLLSPIWGVAENALQSVGLGELFQPWLGLESSALLAVSLVSIWQYVGTPMLLFTLALNRIPQDVFDAARLDGAKESTVFFNIALPLLAPTFGVVTILTFIGNINAFDLVYTMQGPAAGPNRATDLLGTLFHRTYFGFQLTPPDPGLGAALAAVMFAAVLIAVAVWFIAFQRRILARTW